MSYDILFEFEKKLAEYTGAPYTVVTDCCTHAIELCMLYDGVLHTRFTSRTYLSVPMTLFRMGIDFEMFDGDWEGEYQFLETRIWDSARMLMPNMYRTGQMQCLSFGNTKPLHLGRCGAILLDDKGAYEAISAMRSDGRNLLEESKWAEQKSYYCGYHYCPTLEICELGIEKLKTVTPQCQKAQYPDCRDIEFQLYPGKNCMGEA